MRILRKLMAILVYATVLLPCADVRITAWVRAIEITSTSLDKTLRRRKSKIENERVIRHLALLQLEEDREEKTMRRRIA